MMKKKRLTYVLTGALAVGILGAIPAFAAEDDAAQSTESNASIEKDTAFGGKHGGGRGKFGFDEEQLKEKAEELGIDTTEKNSRELAKEVMEAQLEKKAKELGIETEGKDHHALMQEIRKVQIESKAKELGISTEGKELAELVQEVREALVKKEAKELGIETEGKELKALADEVRNAALQKQAKELGVETEGRDSHQLMQEVFDASILKAAKELGIETEGKSTKELMKEIMTDHADEAKEMNIFPFNKEKDFFFHGGGQRHHGPGHGKGFDRDAGQNIDGSAADTEDTL
ncbi:hypothetical protein D3H55_11725 [Bacillus salacetis]|uniref:Transporter n=1 Tax=Bacillus salacetis TaxID=2315464 RepID=A0A3A1QXW5_9BACI|nr:hypothetical protein [Bacillus salacetis]RIW33319.1 hypothetical protein D3H55_11725 [Bacillus salacetis]